MEQIPETKRASTIICQKSEVTANIKFGQGCIIHPNSAIIAEGGDIVIGDYNIIEERVNIVNRKNKESPSKNKTMIIGSYNMFEVGSKIDTCDIGDFNTFEARCIVEQGCIIKNKCSIGSTIKIPQNTVLDEKKIHFPDKVIKEMNFDEQKYKKNIIQMHQALSILIPQNNPCKTI
ncbi:hypothetical protein IMG5_016210 [Ichthyophthirius multifiliis]|uniref:Dynactin subunit 6 n=1 Tax=Ichthyophthirius multifiliis TaxID=5932 RepID=G0QKC6_ICHMU|nr:hypothetical protein IMG5_016210 [Ichthyophthirius multifiliis]EGR34330.1 hypothetical protein IMG5_016210 [Ichthyophthirius multifiliis]|eukprot:XP_004039634.1 hypothetical protein IMG5_016210 [Ichthyophthirius multifiliis]